MNTVSFSALTCRRDASWLVRRESMLPPRRAWSREVLSRAVLPSLLRRLGDTDRSGRTSTLWDVTRAVPGSPTFDGAWALRVDRGLPLVAALTAGAGLAALGGVFGSGALVAAASERE